MTQPAGRPRPPAPYLQRRGQVFYFRKRLSRRAARLPLRSDFDVSLRTTRIGEARMRAARVLVELQRAETRMSQLDPVDTLEPEQAKRILSEVARCGLGDLLARHDSGEMFEDDADVLIEEIVVRIDRLKGAARTRDFSAIADALRQAAAVFQVDLSDPVPMRLGLDATRILIRLAEIERRAVDLDDPRDAAEALVARFSETSVDDFVKPPVSLTDALARMRVATGSDDGTARLWDLGTGAEITRLEGHGDWVRSVAFSLDGTRLATGSRDRTTRLWDIATGAEIARLALSVRSLDISKTANRLAIGDAAGRWHILDILE